ncbi:hypothetical protein ACJA29_01755 [Metamycoplasma sualvi]|uniref:hypothetical protein n=1 Tax=Metamycoplasma sualvi TaxID=2125 RepID=UPI0038733311
MSIVSCGNNNNNSVDQLPPAGDNKPGGGDNSTPGGGDNSTPGGGDNDNQQPTITYIDVNDRNGMIAHILQSNYIVSEFIKQVTRRQVNGTVTYVEWNKNLTSIEPGSVAYHTDGSHHYYNVKNLTFTITTDVEPKKVAALYYSVNNEDTKYTVSAKGSWTISVDLHFKSTTKIENV